MSQVGVILSRSKGECGGVRRCFVVRWCFLQMTNIRRSVAAEAVTFVAPKVTKRRSLVIRNASLPHRPLRTIRQNHGLQHSFPTDRSRWALASESAAMPLTSAPPTTVLPDFGRSCSADRSRPTPLYLPFKNFVIARSQPEHAGWQRRGKRKVSL